jgi:hypothetical protein
MKKRETVKLSSPTTTGRTEALFFYASVSSTTGIPDVIFGEES